MTFLEKLFSLLSSPSPRQDANSYFVTVQCLRCGENIHSRVNLSNDLSLDNETGNKTIYFCRKVLMGTQRCFQRVEVELTFDKNRNLIDKKISGGKFVEA